MLYDRTFLYSALRFSTNNVKGSLLLLVMKRLIGTYSANGRGRIASQTSAKENIFTRDAIILVVYTHLRRAFTSRSIVLNTTRTSFPLRGHEKHQ